MPQITSNIFWQSEKESVVQIVNKANFASQITQKKPQSSNFYQTLKGSIKQLMSSASGKRKRRKRKFSFIHILNTYADRNANGLDATQQQTIATMEVAKSFSEMNSNDAIDFVSVQEGKHKSFVPKTFCDSINLDRNSTSLEGFKEHRELPFVFDVLNCGHSSSINSDYIIFTNADICLVPHFYTVVSEILSRGFDSMIINRRTVDEFSGKEDVPLALADMGKVHPGLDCFVFPRKWMDSFVYNKACIGTILVMRGLVLNMVAHAQSLIVLTRAHLTYHYGDDRTWQAPEMQQFRVHNHNETLIVSNHLKQNKDYRQRLDDFYIKRPEFRPETIPIIKKYQRPN